MENLTPTEQTSYVLTEDAIAFLKETSKWAYFLSIIGFIGIGLIVLLAVFAGIVFSKLQSTGFGNTPNPIFESGLISFIYLALALLYFFPVYYLFQFSSKAKNALAESDNAQLCHSFEYLKSHYKYLGIFTVVILLLYGFIIFIAMIGGILSFL